MVKVGHLTVVKISSGRVSTPNTWEVVRDAQNTELTGKCGDTISYTMWT